MLDNMRIQIPWWLTVIIILETLPMFLGPLGAIRSPEFLGGPEAVSLNQATFIYLARNLAVGLAFIIAFFLKNGPMLFILIFIRLVTDLIDLPTFLYFDLASNPGRVVAIFVFLYYIPAIIGMRYIWNEMTKEGA